MVTSNKHNFIAFAKALLKKYPIIDLGQQNANSGSRRISLSLVKPGNGQLALDAGCREGQQTAILKEKGYRVIPVDVVKVFPDAQLVDLNKPLPFNNQCFDLIYCSEVLEHLIDPLSTVREFIRVLRPCGKMIITTPNSFCIIFRLLSFMGITQEMINKEDHVHFFSMNDMSHLFPDSTIYGFFPLFPNFRIKTNVGNVSPTFIIEAVKKSVSNVETSISV